MCRRRPCSLCCDAIYGKRESAAFSEKGATTLHPCRGCRFWAGQSHSKTTFHDTSFSFHVWFQSQTTILFQSGTIKRLVLPCLQSIKHWNTTLELSKKLDQGDKNSSILYSFILATTLLYSSRHASYWIMMSICGGQKPWEPTNDITSTVTSSLHHQLQSTMSYRLLLPSVSCCQCVCK